MRIILKVVYNKFMYDSPMNMHEERELPQFTLRQIDLPEVIKMEVNEESYLIVKVKMIAKRNRQDIEAPEDKEKIEGDFQILSIKALGDKPVDRKTMEQQDFERVVAKAKSGKYA